VLLQIETPNPQVRIGMSATGEVETLRRPNALVIPRRALIEDNGQTFVQRIIGGQTPTTGAPQTERIAVRIGVRTEDVVEILDGLQEGDQVEARSLPPATPLPGVTP
jgi:hypothetical protein